MVNEKQSTLSHGDLWIQFKENNSEDARKELIVHYMKIVDVVVNRLAIGLPKNISRDDLTGYGIMGLIDAVNRFDHTRGWQFETYASWRIRGAIIDSLRQSDWVPRSVREKAKRIEEAYGKLEQLYMRDVKDEEISEYLQVSLEEFQKMLQDTAISTIMSFDDPIKEEENESRLSLLIDYNAVNPESKVNEVYLKQMLSKSLEKLTVNEKQVVTLFYFEELSLSEIAEVMNLSPSRISQLHSKAILRLRGSLSRFKSQLFV
jgi:RNA polymerase sigma factor for flagellar operon FliA